MGRPRCAPWHCFLRRFRFYKFLAAFLTLLTLGARGAESPVKTYPLWDGHESVAEYAARVNLPAAKTLDLGNDVKLELALIPAGEFVLGTPKPEPLVETGLQNKILQGQLFLLAYGGVLLVMVGFVIVRAIRLRRPPQYSLGYFMAMMLMASVGVLGAMHWWYWKRELKAARAGQEAAIARYMESSEHEKPALGTTLSRPFYMGRFPVTRGQYQQVGEGFPGLIEGKDNPVDMVSWDEAQSFCKSLGAALQAGIYLPTEAEWEYACRAGTTTKYYSGDKEEDLQRAAWYAANSEGAIHPVGQKEPNKFGLCDMHGNVWQWCQNWFGSYTHNAAQDPQGPGQGLRRAMRGGAYNFGPLECRSASRAAGSPRRTGGGIGFRVVLTLPPGQ